MRQKGFTLIELLIVVALIGILAVALLSAINPVEQTKKARDVGRKSDSAELLNAYERYFSTYGCYPWEGGAGTACADSDLATANPSFATGGNSARLLTTEEVKTQFQTRASITGNLLWVSETAADAVSVCFEPESNSARTTGLGPNRNLTNSSAATCTGSYSGGGSSATCYVCVPQ